MRLPGTLLALVLAVLSPAVRAADEPDLLAAVKHPAQQKILRDGSLVKPPDLRRYGWTLDADGVYRSVAAAIPAAPAGFFAAPPAPAARRTASAEQLAAALARWRAANGTALLAPPAEVAPRTVEDAAALARHDRRAVVVAAVLKDDGAALTAAQRFDTAFGNPGGTIPPKQEALKTGLRLLGAQRLSEGAALQLGENGKPSSWAGLTSSQIDAALAELDSDDASIRARRAELVALVASGTGEQRGRAIKLLGYLHDDTLLPVLLPALMREKDFHNRKLAAAALASIVESYKAKEGGWSAFLEKAPPILNVMFKAVPDWNYGENVRGPLQTSIDLLNLMEPADKKRFLAGFNDPRVLLMMMSLGDTTRIRREAGVHSDSAALMYARYKELASAQGSGLGAFLNDPAVSPETRATLLDRLTRYKYIGPELERDETFRRALPALLFGPGSKVISNTVFSIAVLAAGMPKAEFARHSMAFIRASSSHDARAALVFFLLHPQMLDGEQRAELNGRVDGLDAHMRQAMDEYRRTPSVYAHWPKTGPIDAALLMTQEGHAQLFMKTLTSLGYRPEPGAGGATRFKRGQVRLSVYRFASDKDGWAVDSAAVGRAVAERLRDPKFQVVVYRGHVGDYGKSPLDEPARGKVFIDLSCDSESQSSGVMAKCDDCAFFGTNQTAEGAINNSFLPEALAGLGARESFADMNKRFQTKMPKLFHRFTGSWSAANVWEAASGR